MPSSSINSHHYKAGEDQPAIDPKRITIMNMRYCPYATRTMLVLLKKGLDFDTININLTEKPSWFLKTTPVGKVPVILHNDFVGLESAPLCQYLDEKYPEPRLGPNSPEQKVLDANLLDEVGRKFTPPYYRVLVGRDPEEKEKNLEELLQGMEWLDKTLTSKGRGPFFSAGRGENQGPGLLDYYIWPFTPLLRLFGEMGIAELPWERFPNLARWLDLMDKDSAIKSYSIPKEAWFAFRDDTKAGKVDRYDRL